MIWAAMHKPSPIRRAVVSCLVLVLLVALTPSGTNLPAAIFVTLFSFVPVATFVFPAHIDEQNHPQQTLELPTFSPRPPPAQ
jgi:hypothetical protein